ncbi:restriction endonuclease subunit S [Desulfobulbus oligotrophicus]|uniref:Restriction endonuclease subunit S n=1 Tax=Desulfobulbus oligotrophicus TaxID=1909699 RepID=A0A7T6APY6_9BACT|nr:restriction endonuclease subunit S [Desulfobulbus oligotrophicus]QQG65013.1 restriction endonuclease subunit S [Desulfobulbus oligotrophicus]
MKLREMQGSHEGMKTRRIDWKTIPLRYVCQLNPSVDFSEFEEDDELTFLPMDRVKNGYFFPNTDKFSRYTSSYNAFEEGDIVLAKVTPCFENGNIAVVQNLEGGKGFGSSELFVIRPKKINRKFLFYYFQSSSFKQEGEASMTGAGGLKRVSPDLLRQHHLPYPDSETQRLIADYLDRETARIDALVAEKEKMLALLEEKRAALISRAVTRGLDPTVPLKPSGLDWLEDIPAHWEILPIKYVATVGNGSTPTVDNSDYWDDEGFPWMNSSVVNMEVVTGASRGVTDKALKECHLPIISPPAVLVGITGQGKTRGMASILMRHATINQHLAYLKPQDGRLLAEYLRFVLVRAYSFLRSDSDGAGSTKGAITCDQIGNFRIPIPAIEEQVRILLLIKQGNEGTKNVKKELENSIRLLRERRAALITAAVTGQISKKEMRI